MIGIRGGIFTRKRQPSASSAYPDDAEQPSAVRASAGKQVAAKLSRNPMVDRLDYARLGLFLRRDFASAEECAQLRAMIDAGARPSPLFAGTQGPDYRTSQTCGLHDDEPLVRALVTRICALMGVDPGHAEPLQGQRYMPGQEYKPHWDYFPQNDSYWQRMRAMGGQRTWTAMLYCSDVAAGGETCFVHSGLSVAPVEGMLLAWNNMGPDGAPNVDSAHAALPVGAGTKYVLTQWFRERAWAGKDA